LKKFGFFMNPDFIFFERLGIMTPSAKNEHSDSYNRGNMARKFLPGCRKQPDYG
jgi:hypothetical protein